MSSPIQTILFGSPGTGKSYRVKRDILPELGITQPSADCIPTVFHPEYSYGDFMGKLLPHSVGGKVEYKYHAGHFLTALARAYENLLFKKDSSPRNVALVIDEINRGNSAAIFGTIFQLLDRQADGWSAYEIAISGMEFDTLLEKMGASIIRQSFERSRAEEKYYKFPNGDSYSEHDINKLLEPLGLIKEQIRLPPNLSIIATMNTSDNSIYYMDTAFKRRWDWQFVDNDSGVSQAEGAAFIDRREWEVFVNKLNKFVRDSHRFVRKVEDKQIGYWFIVGESITKAQIQHKLMFYLWDGVFGTNPKPLVDLLGVSQDSLVTFGDFSKQVDTFIGAINKRSL